MKHNKLLYILLIIIVILLSYLVFKPLLIHIHTVWEIYNRKNIFYIHDVNIACKDSLNNKSSSEEFSPECVTEYTKYSELTKKWDRMILMKSDISCKDFDPLTLDAFDFYYYISGNLTSHNNCAYDPYGLDSDGDCVPCEKY